MAKKKTTRKTAGKKTTRRRAAKVDSADGMRVGDEPVPGLSLRCICRGHRGTIGRIAWSPCGRFIASPSQDMTVRIWDADRGDCLGALTGHEAEVICVSWSPDGKRIATASGDGTAKVWEISAAFEDDGAGTLIGNLRAAAQLDQWHDAIDVYVDLWAAAVEICPVQAVSWHPDGGPIAVATGSPNNGVVLWDAEAGTKEVPVWRSSQRVASVSWAPNGERLAFGGSVVRTWSPGMKQAKELPWGGPLPLAVTWSADSNTLAAGVGTSIPIWSAESGQLINLLEFHTDRITCVSFGCDGRIIGSRSRDGAVILVRTDAWEPIAVLQLAASMSQWGSLMFHPRESQLATLGDDDTTLHVWDLDLGRLLRRKPASKPIQYTSAKVILVGPTNVGKSCLAMRLAENRYPEDHEHGTTHGMQFWPMEAEALHPSAKPPDGQRRDVVLWDFGGQDEYQLIHQMFLHDTTLALVLIDPTRGRAAMDEAREWNRRLEKHLGHQRAVKLLVGAKQDRRSDLIHITAIKALCKECGFADFIELSAKTNRRIPTLRKAIAGALDWEQLAKTSRPDLFQRIRDEVEDRRRKGEVVVLLRDLKRQFTDRVHAENVAYGTRWLNAKKEKHRAIDAVSDQLATQGIVVKTSLAGGDEALVLQLPVIERYAGSLIVAARNNPRGVPVLEDRLLGKSGFDFPGIKKRERLRGQKERTVLECVVELMIRHGLCFRHGGLLVFPTLFPSGDAHRGRLTHGISLYYDFTGAIDNIYASLVSQLMVGEVFGEGRLEAGRVEFDQPGEGMCGIRQVKYKGGFAHLDLFFAGDTRIARKDLFTRFVEDHLRLSGVDITEHQAIKCACGQEIGEDLVQKRIANGHPDVVCPVCEAKTLISEGAAKIRERDPESDQHILALRKRIEQETATDAAIVKGKVAGKKPVEVLREKLAYLEEQEAILSDPAQKFTVQKQIEECREKIADLSLVPMERPVLESSDESVRLLHLSDLHFTGETSLRPHVVALLQDIRNGEFLGFDSVEYLVISGDMTDRGDSAGFEKARGFVGRLIEELGLSAQRCIFVPGNHDVQDTREMYRHFWSESEARSYEADESRWHREGSVVFVQDRDDYSNRLRMFSDAFFHKIRTGERYPLDPAEQGLSYLFADTGIQFVTLNSAWCIDKFHRDRSGISQDAVAGAIDRAGKEVKQAVESGDFRKKQSPLRIAVWHHALEGKWAMQEDAFVEQLQLAGVRLCLHGDVHEMRRKWIGYWNEDKSVHVVGAGTFGSPEEGRPESTPRLYNLLEIRKDLQSIRVHTRRQRKSSGAWSGWHEWPDPDGGRGKVPYFDIKLS